MWWWWFSHRVMSDSCNPMDCSLPGSSVHEILQARILEWIAIPSLVTEYRCRKKKSLSVDVRKSFALMIKPLRKLGREGHFHT